MLRGRLKHSWLENQLLNKTTDEVVYLWGKMGWWALETEFSERVKEVIYLADDLEDGFSPAQLVDHLAPFAKFDPEIQDDIKQAVHIVYLKSSRISDLKMPLQKDAMALGNALDELRDVWRLPMTEDNEVILRKAWQEVSKRAKTLHSLMERLPMGVMLP